MAAGFHDILAFLLGWKSSTRVPEDNRTGLVVENDCEGLDEIAVPLSLGLMASRPFMERAQIMQAQRMPGARVDLLRYKSNEIPLEPPQPNPEGLVYLTGSPAPDRGQTLPWPHEQEPDDPVVLGPTSPAADTGLNLHLMGGRPFMERSELMQGQRMPGARVDLMTYKSNEIPLEAPQPNPEGLEYLTGSPSPDRGQTFPWPHEQRPDDA